ncbi:unnamed protein product, partial [marine sediment metagenome]
VSGWYISQYKPLHQTVIRVNDTNFNMNYYVKMLKYYGEGMPTEYMQFMADEVVKVIEQNELVRQKAMELGISISDDAVDKERKSRDPPLSRDYRDPIRTEMLVSKLHDEYFDQKVPVYAEQRHIMAMLLESEIQASEIRAELEQGGSFSELASELSLENFSRLSEGDLGWQPKGILPILLGTTILEDYVFGCEVGVLSQAVYDEARTKNVGYWLIKVLEREEEPKQANVQVILLGSEEEAQDIRDKLEASADFDKDFADFAKELSHHDASKANGGDLGWFTPDMASSAIDEFVFNYEVELGTLSEPIRDESAITKGGYWLVKVLDKADNRQIEDADRDLLKAELLNEWIEALWDDPENIVESYLDNEQKKWALDRV